jgi:voltage-gated potassium channel
LRDARRAPAYPTPRLGAGIALPLRALVDMARDPASRGQLWLVFSLFAVGTAYYSLVEGWSVTDALYFCAMTLATVGFGDIVPDTAEGKLFTVVYVIAGIGTLVTFFSTLAARTLALQARRIEERERITRQG